MFRSLFKGVGKLFLLLAAMAFLALVSVFVIGSFILTWPVLRMSPRDRRLKSSMDFASSGMTMLTAFTDGSVRKAVADAMEESPEVDVIYPYNEGDAVVLGPNVFVARDGSVLNWRGENFIPQSLSSVAEKIEADWEDDVP